MRKELENTGITLIALIITIIVLLILAGVSISMVVGDNGILTQAVNAADRTKEAQEEEEKALSKIEKEINNYLGAYDVWNGTDVSEPEIEDYNIYIYTCAELKWLADEVNGGETFDGYNVYLMSNLDLGASWTDGELTSGTEWTPIGSYNNDNTYRLNAPFEGNGYVIKNVYVNTTNNFAGVFGNSSSITNLTVIDSYISGATCTAGIVGAVRSGEVANCIVENVTIISSGKNSGGIVGQFQGTTITNCSSSGTITGSGRVGGIIGYFYSGTEISKCVNYCSITSSAQYCGGISGNSYGLVNECCNYGSILGTTGVGGVCGTPYSEINNCYNSGSVSCESKGGGISYYSGVSCDNCYNIGTVYAESPSSTGPCAGIIGWAAYSPVSNCYNFGSVSGASSAYVGGVIGRLVNSGASATNCYCLTGTVSKVIYSYSVSDEDIVNCVFKDSDEMNATTLLLWLNEEDDTIWKADSNNINQGYPIFSWQ